jgi:4'-phosphopantetheinyl transferase
LLTLKQIHPFCSLALLDMTAFEKTGNYSEKREKERAAALFALKALFHKDHIKIVYDAYNKPHLEDATCHISISHSFDKLAVIQHQTISTGIDIEKMRDKISTIQHKFLSPQELTHCQNDVSLLTLYWAVKEAVYKAYGKKNLSFNEHIIIPFAPEKERNTILAYLITPLQETTYELQFEYLDDDYVMAYVMNESV